MRIDSSEPELQYGFAPEAGMKKITCFFCAIKLVFRAKTVHGY